MHPFMIYTILVYSLELRHYPIFYNFISYFGTVLDFQLSLFGACQPAIYRGNFKGTTSKTEMIEAYYKCAQLFDQ